MTDPLARVIGRLDALGQRGHGRRYRCPAHDDRTPSLTISVLTRATARNPAYIGAVMLHCHAGCSRDAILEALDLSLSDLFPRRWGVRDRSEGQEYVQTRKDVEEGRDARLLVPRERKPRFEDLEREFREGVRLPLGAGFGALPNDAEEDVQAVYHDLSFVRGLYLAADWSLPTPYSVRFCAGRLGWDKNRAHRALCDLARLGVVERVQLAARGGRPNGLFCYAPPLPVGAVPVEPAHSSVDGNAAVQVAGEVDEELGVLGAESRGGEVARGVASRVPAASRDGPDA